MTKRTIHVKDLARVEGEGALHVTLKDDVIEKLQFSIHEPPRYFEALLQGRMFHEAPDITARICGICPVAYMTGASQAMEDALDVTLTGPLRDLRRLVYCGEWIESHALHIYMLHAPDFLGMQDSIQMAEAMPDAVVKALRLKKLGNTIIESIGGGRAIHPINLAVGGFHKLPPKSAVKALAEELKWGIQASIETIRLVGTFDFPNVERDYQFVAMRHEDEYAITEGRIVSNRGLDIPVSGFHDHFEEQHVERSNALQSVMKDGSEYLVGPLARYALNYDKLSSTAQSEAKAAGLGKVVRNPFQSIVVRAVETLQACEDALAIVENYVEPDDACMDIKIGAGTGSGCTEAPRGLCHHRYSLNADGTIAEAVIIPPTSQNQLSIESDLREVVQAHLSKSDDDLQWICEQAVRNYDPCISCATHFLKLDIQRG